MKIGFWPLIALFVAETAFPAVAEPISREALLQYQLQQIGGKCDVVLPSGIALHWDEVAANENNEVAIEEIAVLTIRTATPFSFGTVVKVTGRGSEHLAKVVKVGSGSVSLALGADFLNDFWGSDEPFEVRNTGIGPYSKSLIVDLGDDKKGRLALSEARTCRFEELHSE